MSSKNTLAYQNRQRKHAALHAKQTHKHHASMPLPNIKHVCEVYVCKTHDYIEWYAKKNGQFDCVPTAHLSRFPTDFISKDWPNEPCPCAQKIYREVSCLNTLVVANNSKRVGLVRKHRPCTRNELRGSFLSKRNKTATLH